MSSQNIVYPFNTVKVQISTTVQVAVQSPLDANGYVEVRRMLGNETYGWVTSGGSAIDNLVVSTSGTSDTIALPIGVRNITITANVSAVTTSLTLTLYYVDPTQNLAVPYVSSGNITTTGAYYLQAIDPPARWFKVGWSVAGTSTISLSYYAWL